MDNNIPLPDSEPLQPSNGCVYLDLDESNTRIREYKLNVLHLNIRSLNKNKSDLLQLLEDLAQKDINVDFILLCETMLHDSNSYLIDLPGYHHIIKSRDSKLGGGLAIYYKTSIDLISNVCFCLNDSIEYLLCDFKVNGIDYLIGEMYRIPNSKIETFDMGIDEMLCFVNKYKRVIIGTDQNLDLSS